MAKSDCHYPAMPLYEGPGIWVFMQTYLVLFVSTLAIQNKNCNSQTFQLPYQARSQDL